MMRLITINVTEYQLESMNKLVDKKVYPNRSVLIRTAISDLLKEHQEDSNC